MTANRARGQRHTRSSTILVIDDQPFELQWLMEYLAEQGYVCENAMTLKDGIEKIEASEKDKYRVLIIDMEILTGGYVGRMPKEEKRAALYRAYPGLLAVQEARNYDYNSSNVFVYSVHRVKRSTRK